MVPSMPTCRPLYQHDNMIPCCKQRFTPTLALPLVVLCEVSQILLE